MIYSICTRKLPQDYTEAYVTNSNFLWRTPNTERWTPNGGRGIRWNSDVDVVNFNVTFASNKSWFFHVTKTPALISILLGFKSESPKFASYLCLSLVVCKHVTITVRKIRMYIYCFLNSSPRRGDHILVLNWNLLIYGTDSKIQLSNSLFTKSDGNGKWTKHFKKICQLTVGQKSKLSFNCNQSFHSSCTQPQIGVFECLLLLKEYYVQNSIVVYYL